MIIWKSNLCGCTQLKRGHIGLGLSPQDWRPRKTKRGHRDTENRCEVKMEAEIEEMPLQAQECPGNSQMLENREVPSLRSFKRNIALLIS